MKEKVAEEKVSVKKNIELVIESVDDIYKYVGKIKTVDIDTEDYLLTIYKKGSIVRRLRRLGVNNEENVIIKYKEIV